MRSHLLAILLFLGSLVFHLAGIGTLPLLDRDEPRFSEASREMLERKDYVVPYFNNQERLDKPPFFYWCQAASYRLFGESDFAARFPSALAAALTGLLIFGLGSRLYDHKKALMSSIVFTLCFHTFFLAKAAVVDMWLVFFMTTAWWAGWELLAAPSKRWWWVFYSALGLAFLTKGPVGFLPVASILIFAAWTHTQNINRPFRFEIGILFAAFLIALWAVPALLETKGAFLRVGIGKHVIERSIQTAQGHGGRGLLNYFLALPYYFVTFFASFFPWSLFFLPVLRYFRKKENRDPRTLFLLSGVLPIFFVFTLIKTKLPHYTFPAIPLLSLLLTHGWFELKYSFRKWLGVSLATAVLWLGISILLFPVAARFFAVPQLVKQSAPWLTPETEFASLEYNEPGLVWCFRKYVRGWHRSLNEETAAGFMQGPNARVCVLPTARVSKVFPHIDPAWKVFRTQGINFAKGRRVDLTMLLKI